MLCHCLIHQLAYCIYRCSPYSGYYFAFPMNTIHALTLYHFLLVFLFLQSKAKAEKNQAMEHSMSENSCQLCAVEKLTFEPPPIYCTPCGARIKRNAMYFTTGSGDTRYYFCIPCYNEVRSDTIEVDGVSIAKARLEKKKNDEETEEWVGFCALLSFFFVEREIVTY